MLIENLYEDLLGYTEVLAKLHIGRFQEVMECIRHHCHLLLDNFEIGWDGIPDVSVTVLVRVIQVSSYTLEKDNWELSLKLLV